MASFDETEPRIASEKLLNLMDFDVMLLGQLLDDLVEPD